ncbi:DNA damage-inducible protein 1 [Coelomomyces lativittatus]|nr:DNA damage-inducible protein 1 [Coelomomyces lativittatus]KAJ1517290.1 DNA damage-inducible protein 1 [Coelomomyces lativittatus]
MRISLTSTSLADFLHSMDVSPDFTVHDLTSLVEAMLGHSFFRLIHQTRPLSNLQRTLSQEGVQEEDMILIEIMVPSSSSSSSSSSSNPTAHPPTLERLRQPLPFNPTAPSSSSQNSSKYSTFPTDVLDPYNVEMQKKIEEAIRLERVSNNFELAMEHHPESFAQVHMLYVHCEVNGVGVNALVDSGAQTTIVSSEFAETCHLMPLVDGRFQGTAKGVGTAAILGRVHVAPLKLGNVHLMCSFTVMQGRDIDVLLGLDMLRRHQVILDFKMNVLHIQGEHIPFLNENPVLPSSNTKISNHLTSSTTPSQRTPSQLPTSPSGSSIHPSQLQTLMDMGASLEEAKKALDSVNGNLDLAAALLFSP